LLEQVVERLRVKHYSLRTEKAYVDWIKRYIWFHGKRHPKEMGAHEVEAFLSNLAVELLWWIRCLYAVPNTGRYAALYTLHLFILRKFIVLQHGSRALSLADLTSASICMYFRGIA
jgi:hypothetical protein